MNVAGAGLAGFRMCVLAGLAICAGACNLDNSGFDPPRGRITYPVGLALSNESTESGAPRYLFVSNSNFDLRYNAGSVHAYDLGELELMLREGRFDGEPCWEPPADQPQLDGGAADAGEAPDADLDAGGELDAGDDDAGEDDAGEDDAGEDDAGEDDAGEDDAGDELDAGDQLDADADQPDAEDLPDAGDVPDASGALDAAQDGAADSEVPRYMPEEDDFAPGRDTPRGTLCDGRNTDAEDESVCCFGSEDSLDRVRTSEVLIDSYASGLALSHDGAHLYVTVRGQTRLVYLDVMEGGRLSCGEQGGRCRRGPALGATGLTEDSEFELQPTAIVTGTLAELGTEPGEWDGYVATAHELGSVSLFGTRAGKPKLLDSLQLNNVSRVVSLSKDPNGLLLVSAASTGVVIRLGARRPAEFAESAGVEATSENERELVQLYGASSVGIIGLSGAGDMRDVLVDPRSTGAEGAQRMYALMRGPRTPFANLVQSVVFLELPAGALDGRFAQVVDAVRVGTGPSKLAQMDLGERHLLFASCYDEGSIYVIDADARQIITVIREVSGPFDMQVDPVRQLLYVGDFRASVVRVVDLRGLVDRNKQLPRVVATLGAPTFQGGIK